jgi:hypothetical protein
MSLLFDWICRLIFQQKVKEIKRRYGMHTAMGSTICQGGVEVVYRIFTEEKADWISINWLMTLTGNEMPRRRGLPSALLLACFLAGSPVAGDRRGY